METGAKVRTASFLLFLSLGVASCGGGGGGGDEGGSPTGPNSSRPGNPSLLTAVSQAVPATACANGGIEVKAGIDENLNGLLDDPGEVDIIQYVCNGANGVDGADGADGNAGTNGLNGISALVAVSDEPAGGNCVAGGKSVKSGPDTNGNGILDTAEVTSTDYVCNGVNGTNGTDGTDGIDGTNGTDGINGTNGANSLLSITSEPVGSNCASGGLKVVSWLDTIANGVRDGSEPAFTNYVCNGPGSVVVQSITANPAVVRPGANTTLTVTAVDGAGSSLTYLWSGPGGITSPTNASTNWQAPAIVGSYLVSVQISNGPSTTTAYVSILVSVAPSGPVVSSVTPAQARPYDEIVISGGGFGSSQGFSTLAIGNVTANSIVAWSDNQIRALVPNGATTGAVLVTVGGAQSTAGYLVVPWNNGNNVAISTAAGHQANTQMVPDGRGGAIIVWEDQRSGTSDIYAQRVNSVGTVQWTADGVVISASVNNQSFPQVVPDGSGGAIIAWQDSRNGNLDIYAQRVVSAGIVLWTANGVAVSTAALDQRSHQLVPDGSGGAIIAWGDSRSGNFDIYAQRMNSAGVAQWTANGVVISTVANIQYSPQLVSDGSGGAIIAWEDYRSGTNYDVFAQRVNNLGAVQWTANGVAISTVASDQFGPQMVADGSGGAIIAWEDLRSGTNYDIYAQRVNSLGVAQWTADGVAISTASNNQGSPQLVADGRGGAIVAWEDQRNGTAGTHDIYAQRVNILGAVQWTANGVAISTAVSAQQLPRLVSDGSDGAIITWQDSRIGFFDIYAQRVNGLGSREWVQSLNGVAISNATNNQYGPKLVADSNGGAIIVWDDYRSATNYDVYAQAVSADGMR